MNPIPSVSTRSLIPFTSQAAMRPSIATTVLAVLLGIVFTHGAAADTLTRTSAFTYDPTTGRLTKEIVEPDSSALCLVTDYSYDAYGNKLTATTRNCNGSSGEAAAPSGDAVIAARTSSNVYDARGQFPTTSSNALSQSESKTFDPKWGTPLTLTGPNGLTTTWQYDSFGRKSKETRADGTQTKWDYLYCSGVNGGTTPCPTIGGAAAVWLIQETPLASDGVTPNGPLSKAYYDALNRPLRKETQGYDGSGASTAIYQDTQYDSLGRPYKQSRPYYTGQTTYWTTLTYDALGRILQETAPDTSVSSTAYNGLTTTVTNAKSQTRTTRKNSQGQIVTVTDAQNQSLTYTYDPFGNLASTTDPLGNVVSLTYDLKGRKTQMHDPDMGTWTYAYDALGQLLRQTDAKAQVATLAYDPLGRLTTRSEADLISHWYYDTYKGGAACNKGLGKLCQSETSTGYNKTTTYDNLGRPSASAVTIDVSTPYSSAATYDAHGRVQTQTYPTGLVVKNVYTPLGYLKEVRNSTSNALYWQADSRDAEGHLLQQTYGNGIQTTQTYTPDNGRLSAIVAGAGNSVQNLSYQYDALGNVTTRSDANQSLTESFVYDSLNRLTSGTVNSSRAGLVTQSFTYDALGGLTSKSDLGTYAYPANGATSVHPHAVSQVTLAAGGSISFAYDANGALTTQTQVDASQNAVPAKSRTQFYTSFGMPQSMGQGTTSAAFYYGPEHQRVKQLSSAQGTTVYVNPGNEGALFYEKDVKPGNSNSTERRHFISAGGQAVAIVKYTTVGNTTTTSVRYLQRDHLGSVTAITNEQGAVIEQLAYEAFGKRRFATGVTSDTIILPQTTDRGFTDHEMLDEIGLVHMNGRVYDPLVGRFLSADPNVPDPKSLQSFNRYSYVQNNPLNATDPSGFNDENTTETTTYSTYFSDGSGPYASTTLAADTITCVDLTNDSGWSSRSSGTGVWSNYYAGGPGPGVDKPVSVALKIVTETVTQIVTPIVTTVANLIIQGLQNAADSPLNIPIRDQDGNTILTIGLGPSAIGKVGGALGLAEEVGPLVGGGAKLGNLNAADITRLQNAANRTGTEISVVGSRANGTAGALSDWDYVVSEATSASKLHSLRSSVPEGARGLGEPRNQDFFRGVVDTIQPYITFTPR